jgi:signal transduction histidine kinase
VLEAAAEIGDPGTVSELAEVPGLDRPTAAAAPSGIRLAGPALFAAGFVLAVAIAVLHGINGSTDLTSWWYGNGLLAVGLTAPGALVAQRRPGNPVGWLMCAAGLTEGLCGAGREYLVLGVDHDAPGSLWGGWFLDSLYQVSIATLPLVLLLFPDGRLPSRRWRPAAALAPLGLCLSLVGYLFLGDVAEVQGHRLANPAGGVLPRGLAQAVGDTGLPLIVLSLVIGAVALVLRYRGAEDTVRQQIKWVAWAGSLAAVEIVTELVPVNPWANVTGSIASGLFAVAVAVAILRYRLLDIDVVIARTIVFAALTGAVVGAYLVVVLGLGALLGQSGEIGPPLLATALVAVLFAPLRQRVQRRVDRLVYGERSNPYEAVTRLGRSGTGGDLGLIVDTLAQTLKLPYAALIAPDGTTIAEVGAPAGPLHAHPLRYEGEEIGELRVSARSRRDRFRPDELRLLDDLALQVATAVHAVTLSADLQRSRHRLVAAKEEERRRLRRDLHDGLGPRLAALGLKLDAAGLMAESRPEQVPAVIAEVKDDIRTTLDEIRRLVRGLRPPSLDQLGLVGALGEWAAQLESGDVGFEIGGPEADPVLPAAVEVAAYWIATEAMTNVVRHARARRCTVRVSAEHELVVEVQDDGAGLPSERRAGIGTTSMAERAAELGGTCAIADAPGGGTRVVARLPLADEAFA